MYMPSVYIYFNNTTNSMSKKCTNDRHHHHDNNNDTDHIMEYGFYLDELKKEIG